SITSKRATGSNSRSNVSQQTANGHTAWPIPSRCTRQMVHGLSASITLMAFRPRVRRSNGEHQRGIIGRPYEFKDAEKLVDDFFNEVERVLTERGIATVVVDVEETRRSK